MTIKRLVHSESGRLMSTGHAALLSASANMLPGSTAEWWGRTFQQTIYWLRCVV